MYEMKQNNVGTNGIAGEIIMEKQKVGILTFPNSPSFGASLQMFGLYRALEKMGVKPEVINYLNPYMKEKKHINKGDKLPMVKKVLLFLHNKPGHMKFQRFEKQITLFPQKSICNSNELGSLSERYDHLICGSDQVWNPCITGRDMSYFFDFCCDDSKKIAYAPSFGLNVIPDECKEDYAAELKKFSSLSVREQRAKEIVNELTGRDCPVVIDPSMLIEQSEWRKLITKPKHIPERYIAYFIFNANEKVGAFAKKLSEDKKLPIVTVGGGLFSRLKDRNNTGPIGPDEWLYVIANADYVITDSFHGAAFSIIFDRPLFTSMASATNSRLVTLMDTFEMWNRVIDCAEFDRDGETDYQRVHIIMKKKQNESLAYLKNCLA